MRDRCEEESFCGTERREWTYLAGKWNEMVFAKTVDADFPNEDHFVVIFGKYRIVDNVWRWEDRHEKEREMRLSFWLFV